MSVVIIGNYDIMLIELSVLILMWTIRFVLSNASKGQSLVYMMRHERVGGFAVKRFA